MIQEQNTPKMLTHRQQYINELINEPYWGAVHKYQTPTGWKPGPVARQTLIYNEIVQLHRDIIENKIRISQWREKLNTSTGDNRVKYTRMINSWSTYNLELKKLKKALAVKITH